MTRRQGQEVLMLHIDNIKNIDKHVCSEEHWIIVRSLKNPIPTPANNPNSIVKQVAALSPSRELFYWYLNEKKAGRWGKNAFETGYVPRFINEIQKNRAAKALLTQLTIASDVHDITLYCFCPDETLCHRSIVAGILLGLGAKIDCDPSYKRYFDMMSPIGGGRNE